MTDRKRVPGGLILPLLTLLIIGIGMLPGACSSNSGVATLCFIPETASRHIGESEYLTATVCMVDRSRFLDQEGGWRWTWSSNDGGEIELSQTEMEWHAWDRDVVGYDFTAWVDCVAVTSGTVTVRIEQPTDQPIILFGGDCSQSFTMTITW